MHSMKTGTDTHSIQKKQRKGKKISLCTRPKITIVLHSHAASRYNKGNNGALFTSTPPRNDVTQNKEGAKNSI